MIDITHILPASDFDLSEVTDQVVLDHDDRLRRRIVLTSQGGVRMRLNEAKPVQLRDGDGLRLADGRVVMVLAQPEPLLEIRAHGLADLVRIAWHLGNRHLPTQLLGGALRIRDDHVIAHMVEGLGGHVRRIEDAFDPEGGAYAGGGHAHGHSHDHDHAHGHEDHSHGEAAP